MAALPQHEPRVGRTSLELVPVVLLARGVALCVPMAIAALLGVADVTDAFFYAWAFPAALLVIAGNAVANAATPALADIRAQREADLAGAGATLALLVGVASGLAAALLLGLLGPLLPVLTDFEPGKAALAWHYLLLLLPYVVFMGARVALKATAEVDGAFVAVAAGPLFRGLVTLAVILLGHRALGGTVLPLAFDVGAAIELLWLGAALGWRSRTPVPGLHLDPRLWVAAAAVLPLLAGEGLVAVNLVVDKAVAATLDSGSVSLLEYADLARLVPQTLIEATLLPVAFATWANLVARGEHGAFALQLDQSLRWLAAWTAPMLAGLWVGRHALVSLLFQRGAFDPASAAASADALGWYLPGLWTMFLGAAAMRAHVVLGRYRLVLALGVVSAVTNLVLDLVLAPWMGIDGLALASTLVWWLVPALYLGALRDHWQPTSSWLPVLGIAAASAALAVGLETMVGHESTVWSPMLWAQSVPFFALLGLAAWTTRPATGDTSVGS